ncbi:hypothetical protein CYMTET_44372 [Cymbomonas tetramitiformis]|uniref:Uncharacterized protein n=1 Tax=Cymbomonas tetramitiformis TaxID=36881 RepID=A0AAE0EZ40_9CHLO|nr:hypothetical protein CYMTET_44372 [Cymbomonas tetramitiformis]|eukprot:gene14135-16719_t
MGEHAGAFVGPEDSEEDLRLQVETLETELEATQAEAEEWRTRAKTMKKKLKETTSMHETEMEELSGRVQDLETKLQKARDRANRRDPKHLDVQQQCEKLQADFDTLNSAKAQQDAVFAERESTLQAEIETLKRSQAEQDAEVSDRESSVVTELQERVICLERNLESAKVSHEKEFAKLQDEAAQREEESSKLVSTLQTQLDAKYATIASLQEYEADYQALITLYEAEIEMRSQEAVSQKQVMELLKSEVEKARKQATESRLAGADDAQNAEASSGPPPSVWENRAKQFRSRYEQAVQMHNVESDKLKARISTLEAVLAAKSSGPPSLQISEDAVESGPDIAASGLRDAPEANIETTSEQRESPIADESQPRTADDSGGTVQPIDWEVRAKKMRQHNEELKSNLRTAVANHQKEVAELHTVLQALTCELEKTKAAAGPLVVQDDPQLVVLKTRVAELEDRLHSLSLELQIVTSSKDQLQAEKEELVLQHQEKLRTIKEDVQAAQAFQEREASELEQRAALRRKLESTASAYQKEIVELKLRVAELEGSSISQIGIPPPGDLESDDWKVTELNERIQALEDELQEANAANDEENERLQLRIRRLELDLERARKGPSNPDMKVAYISSH